MSDPNAPPPSLDELPPDYVNADNGPRVIAGTSIMLAVTVILYALRLYARRLAQGQRGWDDHVMIPAFLTMMSVYVCIYCLVIYGGIGRHAAVNMAEDPNRMEKYLLLLYILEWSYMPSIMLSRMSVVILYLRIFTDKWARIACWFVMGFLGAYCVSTLIATNLQCQPFEYQWDKTIEGGTCFDQITWYQVTNIPNIIADVMIMVLPIRTVWSIKASNARKSGIAAVCLTGSIGLIASCARTSVFYTEEETIITDPTWADEPFTWTSVECGMYFSAACLIGMRPLLSHVPRMIKKRIGVTTNGSGHAGDSMKAKTYGRAKHYANLGNDDELALGSVGQHQMTAVTSNTNSNANGHPGLIGLNPSNNIRVETNIEVTHDRNSNNSSDETLFDKNYP